MKVGDVVKLKTGGPAMTVARALSSDWRCVYWNEHAHKFEEFDFYEQMLVPYEQAEQRS